MKPTYMPMSIFFFLWAAIATAQDDGRLDEINITYGTFDSPQGSLTGDLGFGRFGDCIPAASKRTGANATAGSAAKLAICVQYEFEDCKGKVLDQKFELQQNPKPIHINYDTAMSFVCIPKLQKHIKVKVLIGFVEFELDSRESECNSNMVLYVLREEKGTVNNTPITNK
ncbi:hypothetical protein BCR42DRAFT_495928 [Absidia repens]|uniref:Uncharacterized protein n=1 Tax=Absidia repens TaxID=90262 RepID=A0A1X2I1R3_9FUNG|nr:hypothetical protein BCR42DRAFT_495928 [Absidia repens]